MQTCLGFFCGIMCVHVYDVNISVPVVAWGTHIAYSIIVEKYLLLIVGAILPPIGMIHGVGVWFGWF